MANNLIHKRRGPYPGSLRAGPMFPDRVKMVFQLRRSGKKLREIAKSMNMTAAGVNHILNRWGGWEELHNKLSSEAKLPAKQEATPEIHMTPPDVPQTAPRSILKELYIALAELNAQGYFDEKESKETNEPKKPKKPKKPNEPKKPNDLKSPFVYKKERRKGYEKAAQEKGVKLTKQDAMDIFREDRMSHAEIAEIFGVSEATVYQIKHGYTWWKITGMPKHPNCRNNVKNRAS